MRVIVRGCRSPVGPVARARTSACRGARRSRRASERSADRARRSRQGRSLFRREERGTLLFRDRDERGAVPKEHCGPLLREMRRATCSGAMTAGPRSDATEANDRRAGLTDAPKERRASIGEACERSAIVNVEIGVIAERPAARRRSIMHRGPCRMSVTRAAPLCGRESDRATLRILQIPRCSRGDIAVLERARRCGERRDHVATSTIRSTRFDGRRNCSINVSGTFRCFSNAPTSRSPRSSFHVAFHPSPSIPTAVLIA